MNAGTRGKINVSNTYRIESGIRVLDGKFTPMHTWECFDESE